MTLSPPPAEWSRAAIALARRATRRARTGAALHGAAAGTALGALVGAALRVAAGASAEASVAVSGTFGLAGLWAGLRAARRVPATSAGAAAWALDRVAGAHERGLTAALATDAAGATYAGTVPPPRVRMHPPRGLAPMTAAVLLAGLVAAWPGQPAGSTRETRTASRGLGAGAGAAVVEAGRREAEAIAAERDAAAQRKVREALGLPAIGALEPDDVAARLADPKRLEAARLAAPPGASAVAAALASPTDAAAASSLARALSSDGAD
ncbi:MAG TPA: hypothetical protein VND21_01235, partial [Planctomycetota bacterium]|nr:hypothetical protein [Planctomycetota bacterium]